MRKIIFIICILFIQINYAQKTTKFYKLDRLPKELINEKITKVDSEILLYKKGKVINSFKYTSNLPLVKKDSIFYYIEISNKKNESYDSILVKPTYKYLSINTIYKEKKYSVFLEQKQKQ